MLPDQLLNVLTLEREKSNIMARNLLITTLLTFFASNLFGQSDYSLAIVSQESSSEIGSVAPTELGFKSAPNPFSTETIIRLQIPVSGKVSLRIFDILGQEVALVMSDYLTIGTHKLKYQGTELPAGRYYFHLSVGREVIIRQVMKKN